MKKREGCGILSLVIEMERNKSYTINKSTMEDLLEYALENTEIEKLIQLYFGKKKSSEFVSYTAQMITESVVVEKLSKARYIKLCADYGLTGYFKSVDDYESRNEERNKIEHSFAEGMKKFLLIFGDAFNNGEILHKALNKVFKNYRFKDINMVNDYSVLYFTFKLFENFCYDEENPDERKRKATELSNKAYDELKNPYHKKSVTVSHDSMLRYLSKFELEDSKYAYISILIDFVQDLYFAEDLDDVLRFDIYSRFDDHIVRVNLELNNLINDSNYIFDVSEEDKTEKYDEKKISKSVHNKIQYVKDKFDNEVIEDLRELNHIITLIPKNIDDLRKKPRKTYHMYCNQIFELMQKLRSRNSDELNIVVDKIVEQYENIHFGDNLSISIWDVVVLGLYEQGNKELKKLLKTKCEFINVFIALMLSMGTLKSKQEADAAKMLVQAITDKVGEYIDNNITISESSIKRYTETVDFVELVNLEIPMLYINCEHPLYEQYLSKIATRIL